MVCLCLAIASIGRAMQRQSDNRHHLVTQVSIFILQVLSPLLRSAYQAMAFLSRYRSLRGTDVDEYSEIEYNFGRTFHQLGELLL